MDGIVVPVFQVGRERMVLFWPQVVTAWKSEQSEMLKEGTSSVIYDS